MLTRRRLLRLGALAALAAPALASVGCATNTLISSLTVSATTIQPDGSGVFDEADVGFTLDQRADVSATLIGPDGKSYVIRPSQTRAPDKYQIRFRGIIQVPGKDWLRVVPDGRYRLQVVAKSLTSGQTVQRDATITVKNADTVPPEIINVYVEPKTFSPNGDGINDTVRVSYQITKASQVRIYVTDAKGGFYLIQAPVASDQALHSFQWDGTAGGGAVLPDGTYQFHIESTDAAGNFTDYVTAVTIANGGIPRMEITDVKFTPTAVPLGGTITVQITVKNTGTAAIKTLGPPPGTPYKMSQNFASFRDAQGRALYYERPGVWRVGVSWQNAPQAFPVRWGLFKDLNQDFKPGETVTVSGTITVDDSTQHQQVFYAGIIQEGVGYPGGQVGFTPITISY